MIEIIHNHFERGHIRRRRIRLALFDFDGTLSLVREGWQQIMQQIMVEHLLQTPAHEGETDLARLAAEWVAQTTGKETLYQMMQLADEIQKRGGQPQMPEVYKQQFLAQLTGRVRERLDALEAGRASSDDLMVPGARAMLEAMRVRGVTCYLASGTDESAVIQEATALGIAPYFAGIYGARDAASHGASPHSLKKMLVERLVAEYHLQACELIAFGDGFVEIQETKRANGLAVGVASNEAARAGIDEWKRARLVEAGADIIVPDFREHAELVAYLFET